MMKLDLLTSEAVLVSGLVKRVTLPANDGMMEVLAEHMPLIVPLTAGDVTVEKADGSLDSFVIASGLADITNSALVVYVKQAAA